MSSRVFWTQPLFHSSFLVIGALTVVLFGCQKPRSRGEWYRSSPSHSQELGFIVDRVDAQKVQALVEGRTIGARTLSKIAGTYEIYGVAEDELETLFPDKPHARNSFIPIAPSDDPDVISASSIPTPLPQLEIIGVPAAWQRTRGKSATVAVIDSGLNRDHADFARTAETGAVPKGWNFGDGNSDLTDPTDHGTNVAGLIASNRVGVAPEANIVPLKVINSNYKMDEASVIAALRYALEHNISLIHISLAKPSLSPILTKVVQEAERQGALIIAAAGNQGRSCDEFKQYPAALDSPSILSVGATLLGRANPFAFAPYSNFGDCVHIAAPGGSLNEGLWAPVWSQTKSLYHRVAGTSMAAPLVMGAAALLKSYSPSLSGHAIRKQLIQSVKKSDQLRGFVTSEGLLQINLSEPGKDNNPNVIPSIQENGDTRQDDDHTPYIDDFRRDNDNRRWEVTPSKRVPYSRDNSL